MRTFNVHNVYFAYREMYNNVEKGRPVLQKDLGLSPTAAKLFIEAVTTEFLKKDFHFKVEGVEYNLNKIYFKESRGYYRKNSSLGSCEPNMALATLIVQAMTVLSKLRRNAKGSKKVLKASEKDLLVKLSSLYEEQAKINNEISVVLKLLAEHKS